VAFVAFADDEPRGDIECSKQRGRTMPHIAVRAPFRNTRHHRQDRLLAIECLDLAFLIDAENKGSVRWGQIKADDVAYLVDEQRIARQLECLAAVRLQAERRPHSADRGVGKARVRSHRADRPVRRVGRRRTQRSLDHGRNLIVVDGARASRAGFVKQAITAILQKSASPLANGVFMNAEFGSY